MLFRTPDGNFVVVNGPSEAAIKAAHPDIEVLCGFPLTYEESNGIYCPAGEDWVLIGTHDAPSFDAYPNFTVE